MQSTYTGNHMRPGRRALLSTLVTLITLSGLALCFIPKQSELSGKAARRLTENQERLAVAFAQLPLHFEANHGQAVKDAQFVANGAGFAASFTQQGVLIELLTKRSKAQSSPAPSFDPCKSLRCLENRAHDNSPVQSTNVPQTRAPAEADTTGRLLKISWENGNVSAPLRGVGALSGRVNYFTGNDPSAWHRDVHLFERVVYEQIRPGVDLVFYGQQQQMEFDLIVRPGASPDDVVMRIDGAEDVAISEQGELRITASGETLIWKRPLIYQDVYQDAYQDAHQDAGASTRGAERIEIAGAYQLTSESGNHRVRFSVGDYDHTQTLVIDPVLTHSSYLGGNGQDQIQGVGVDAQGNIYVAGATSAANFPTASAFRSTKSTGTDMFISKIDPTGTRLIYSTFLGGNGDDAAQRLAVGSDGSVTVAGYTSSNDFPTSTPAQANTGGGFDAVIARLNPAGSALIYSSYLGGTGEDVALAVALDSAGAAYLTGYTRSANFPTLVPFRNSSSGASEAFVAKFSATGAAIYSTYLGGNAGDVALGIAADSAGNAIVSGSTTSTNFPTLTPIQSAFAGGQCSNAGNVFPCGDVFVTRLTANGSALSYSTYLGGTGDEQANGLTVDASGAAYLTGYTTSSNFPLRTPLQATPAGLSDAFVTKIAANGTSLVYSTYLGGGVSDTGTAIAVDGTGSAYVTGLTESSNFPTANSFQARAGVDAFAARLVTTGNGLAYSTFLGGSDFDQGLAIAVDSSGNAFVAGWTNSNDFPLRTPVQSALGGGICGTAPLQYICEDGFIARITHQPGLFAGGMVNGASFAPGAPVAAGSIVSAFGSDLESASFGAATVPLPTTLGSVTVRMNDIPAPLFFVAGSQVNLQVPWELAGLATATIAVTAAGVALPLTTVSLAPTRPGIFTTNAQGSGQGAILIANTPDLVAPVGAIPGRTSRPANRGETITIFCTGLGPVSNRPASGAAAPSGPLALTSTTPLATIGGAPATVSFSGLAPTFVGLYQVNVSVPVNSQVGGAVPVVLTIGGVASNTVTIAVQ
ncbi:MAG: hypothetical protein EXQ56_13285 [Acidobacteria bacterium]|nr:hypothetical protein [Acidobacteriota bacterium]